MILEVTVVVKDEEVRLAHPGWAVRFEDGSWLCIAHGVDMVNDAFYANTYETKELATLTVTSCYGDGDIPNSIGFEVIPAWEHLCESLRLRINGLRETSKLEPMDIMEMTWQLEEVIAKLNGK